MAKKTLDLKKPVEVTKVGKKPKLFKLGDKASMFYDTLSKRKVLPGQIVEFDAKAMSTDKFKAARQGGHLVMADPGEDETAIEPINQDLVDFMNAGDKAGKISYIQDNYDVNEDDLKLLEAMDDDELLAEFNKTYLED